MVTEHSPFCVEGGILSDEFDVFLDVDNLNHFFDNEDVYDSYHEDGKNHFSIIKRADYQIDVALDHKENLIKKAERLGLYKDYVVADANKSLPFENDSFSSIFSNIIYWLNNPRFVLSEIFRILKKDGRCCIMLPNDSFIEASFYNSFYVKGGKPDGLKFLELIDRGRTSENIKVVKPKNEWEKIITNTGFTIEECNPHLSKTLMQIWDIGLRPLFPFLREMTGCMERLALMDLKRRWVDFFENVGYNIIENDNSELFLQGSDHCFLCYILQKR